MIRRVVRSLMVLLAAASFAQQPATAPKAVLMPPDLAADSYAIYSQLLPSNAIEWGDAARKVWLVEDTTVTQVPDPKEAIRAPKGREADLQALLDGYVQHKAEALALSADGFRTALPVKMLDAAARKRFDSSVQFGSAKDTAAQYEFDGSAGIHSFSQVYFNPNHTLAMVYFGMYCGGLCGEWRWVVLERRDGKWVELPWVHSFTIS